MINTFDSFYKRFGHQFLWPEMSFAALSLIPIFLCAWLFDNILFLKVGLITISLFISANRLKYSFLIMTLHYSLILIGFSLLYLFLNTKAIAFVFLCALMAWGCIYLAHFGNKLRTVGNYTFIPAVYLACEIYQNLSSQQEWLKSYWQFVKLTPLAWITLALFYVLFRHKLFLTTSSTKYKNYPFPDKGEPIKNCWLPSIAIFISVFVSALLATTLSIENPEWLIWSTASVITSEPRASHQKFLQRFLGACLGIILGIGISQLIPHTELIYSLAVLGIMLTLTSFKNYFIGFASRCFFITIAAFAISTSSHVALIRVENVLLGGIIGLIFLNFINYLMQRFNLGKNSSSCI